MKKELTAEYMKEVSKGFKKVFDNALASQNKDYQAIATEIRANTVTVDYAFLADFPNMREWVGDREFKKLEAYNYIITKKNWESSISVDRDVIAYDNLGLVKPKIQRLAEVANEHYNELIFTLLEKNDVCYDGEKFFSKAHMVGDKTYSNMVEGELNKTNFELARMMMRNFKGEHGRPLMLAPTLLVVPPALESVAIELFKMQTTNLKNVGATNPLYNAVKDIVVCPWLKSDKNWFLFDTSKSIKPFILQINKAVEFVAQDKSDSEANFLRREHRFGIDTEDNAGYGLWQMAIGGIVKETE